MPRPNSTLIAAFTISLLIAGVGSLVKQNAPVELSSVEVPQEQVLTVKSLPSGDLRLGTQSEVFAFSVAAPMDYSLRYLTVNLEAEGVDEERFYNPDSWKLYTESPRALVGKGESFTGNELKLRLEPQRGQAFFGEAGKTRFVLVGNVLKTGDLTIAAQLTSGYWLWKEGHYVESWFRLTEAKDAASIMGLPSAMLEKSL